MVVAAVSPWIVAPDAAALLTFLTEVYGAREIGRAPGPGGRIGHAETVVGGTTFVVVDAPEGWAPQPALLRLQVVDLDGVVAAAEAAGGRVVTPPTPLPQGAVGARLTDPWGNLWWLEEQVEHVEVDELLRRMTDPATATVMATYEGSLDTEMRRRA